ncbi:MAG: hypothetical protein ACKV22_00570 [Bryobacteraceae bacterium]
MIPQLEKLAAAGIELVPAASLPNHFLFMREGFVSLVERRGDAFGSIGCPALVTEHGLALLLWRGEKAVFVAKDHEQPASEEQVGALRRFADDLAAALAH